MEEFFIPIQGNQIGAKSWHPKQKLHVLALHGWLDNAASFDKLAPLLKGVNIVAIDLPGHGHSYHLPPHTNLHLVDYAGIVMQVVQELQWEHFIMLGHSMGAGLANLVAGTFPERVIGLGLIDGLGFLSRRPEEAPLQLRSFIDVLLKKSSKSLPLYATQQDAVTARLKANLMHPESAMSIITRGTKQLDDGKWTWRTDPRLLMPPSFYLDPEQVLAFLKNIIAPVRFIRPESGYPYNPQFLKQCFDSIQNIDMLTIPGNHHVHLDSPELVANYLNLFFESLKTYTHSR